MKFLVNIFSSSLPSIIAWCVLDFEYSLLCITMQITKRRFCIMHCISRWCSPVPWGYAMKEKGGGWGRGQRLQAGSAPWVPDPSRDGTWFHPDTAPIRDLTSACPSANIEKPWALWTNFMAFFALSSKSLSKYWLDFLWTRQLSGCLAE